jgi:hypothetical protein
MRQSDASRALVSPLSFSEQARPAMKPLSHPLIFLQRPRLSQENRVGLARFRVSFHRSMRVAPCDVKARRRRPLEPLPPRTAGFLPRSERMTR